MAVSEVVHDYREMRKLLKKATGLKVYKCYMGFYTSESTYRSISQEYQEENAHIAVAQGSWCIKSGGEYKISIYTPTLSVNNYRRMNVQYVNALIGKIRDALNNRFGEHNWSACNEESYSWKPLSRFSFYVQVPRFK